MATSVNTTGKKQCASCNKSSGILTCDGCQLAFCGKHVADHRQELGLQLDGIMQENDLLRQRLKQLPTENDPLLKKIDNWERLTMEKIKTAAENARMALKELHEHSRERILKLQDLTVENIRSAREADDFSEKDLARWKKSLKELKSEIRLSSWVKLVEDKDSPIYLMKLSVNESSNDRSTSGKEAPPTTDLFKSNLQEKFLGTLGPVSHEQDGSIAKNTNQGWGSAYAYTRGRYLYYEGCYRIRFQLENFRKPYRIFLGCMSSQLDLQEDVFRTTNAVGWFGYNQVFENGRCSSNSQKYNYNSSKMEKKDILQLTLDCTKKEISLFHERLKKRSTLCVDEKLTPFPWRFLLVLCHSGDSVTILPTV